MHVWALKLRPGVREDSASPAWLAAVVIFRTLKSSFYFQVLVKFSSYHAKKSLAVYLYINLLFQIITSLWSWSALENLSEFELVTIVITDYMLRYHSREFG